VAQETTGNKRRSLEIKAEKPKTIKVWSEFFERNVYVTWMSFNFRSRKVFPIRLTTLINHKVINYIYSLIFFFNQEQYCRYM
jgi:hypothetical protein